MSPRRQQVIPGTERAEHPELAEAGEEFVEVSAEWGKLGKKRAEKLAALKYLMRSLELKVHKYTDSDGVEWAIEVDDEPRVKVRKTGDADPEFGDEADDEGVTVRKGKPAAEVHPGLARSAMAAQDDANNVEIDSDSGDVTVPDKAAPKAKRTKGKRGK